MKYILNRKRKYYTKKGIELLSILMVGIAIPTLALFIKYKPSYKVSISGEEMGYVNNKEAFEED